MLVPINVSKFRPDRITGSLFFDLWLLRETARAWNHMPLNLIYPWIAHQLSIQNPN